jgi:hypothetical protein
MDSWLEVEAAILGPHEEDWEGEDDFFIMYFGYLL